MLYQTIDLCKDYGSPPRAVLNHVNLQIPKGEVVGLLGPNGAGKTTLLSILLGLVSQSSGQVLIDGVAPKDHGDTATTIGVVPQELAFYPTLSVRENLQFFADALQLRGGRRRHNVEFAVSTTLLGDHLSKRAAQLSGGLKRRLNLAVGLLNRPSVLFLDEPTVGIDPQTRALILRGIQSLNRQGVTVIYTSHYMDEIEQICDRVAIIDRGTVLVQDEIGRLLSRGRPADLRVSFTGACAALLRDRLAARYPFRVEEPRSLGLQTADPVGALRAVADELPATAQIERIAEEYHCLPHQHDAWLQ